MIIDVKQKNSELENDFEIFLNNDLTYTAKLPFIYINGLFKKK